MATLECSRINLNHYKNKIQQEKRKSALIGSMQRSKGMGRHQQREPSSSTDLVGGNQETHVVTTGILVQQQQHQHPPRPTRNNSKLKVLVRSHAMREETSPPRVPTPTSTVAPCITLNTISSVSPNQLSSETLDYRQPSTSLLYNHTPSSPSKISSSTTQNPCLIVSSTIDDNIGTPPLSPLSPLSSPQVDYSFSKVAKNNQFVGPETVTVRTQDIFNSAITRKFNSECQESDNSDNLNNKCDFKTKDKCAVNKTTNINSDQITINSNNSSPKQTSSISSHPKNCIKTDTQRNVDNNTRISSNIDQQQNLCSNNCECTLQNCINCSKNIERNINNNCNNINYNNVVNSVTPNAPSSNNTLTVNRANSKHKLRHQSSSQGSFEGSSSTSPCLSRDSSTELYTDTTGIDLTQFIIETINKNAKDRVMMLKIEQELVTLVKDSSKNHYKFPPMSSYQRMLVHRCAAYFGMDHNIEPSGKAVIVNKTRSTRIPEMRFKDHIREDLLFPEEPRRSILKRDSNSFEDCNYKSPDRQYDNRRSKSFEEREEEYEKARRRIFKDGTMQECNSQEELNWAEMPWPENECSKIRLLYPEPNIKQNRLVKGQSVEGRSETLRPCMAKSYSFGGYAGSVSVLSRGDSITSTHSAGPRLLTKQDSSTSTISWRLSPSSSGYKSQSQRSDSVTPSPTATPHQLSDASGKNSVEEVDPNHQSITEEAGEQTQQINTKNELHTPTEGNQLVWAVTDMQSVPKGSVLIDPQTGQPFTNHDGSIYHFDPSNPPPGFTISKTPPLSPKITTPQRSPIKERTQLPKKQIKTKSSPLKNKSCLINSSTSPSLPVTPPAHNISNSNNNYNTSRTSNDNTTNMSLPTYPIYPNGFVSANVPTADATIPIYQPPIGMVYTPYTIPPPYENRSDGSVSELSGYFVNMAVSDSACTAQPVSFQPQSNGYWTQQPVSYYHSTPPANQQQHQRYPVQIPVAQTQASYYPPNYVSVTPNAASAAPNTELVPVYTNPVQMVYSSQPANPANPVYIQNPNSVVYTPNPVFASQSQASVYSTNITTAPNMPPPNAAYTPPNQCYNQNFVLNTQQITGFEQKRDSHRSTPRSNKPPCVMPKIQSQIYSQVQHPQSSSQSSGGSNSPANTVIAGYFPQNSNTPINYRQTPPETPPAQGVYGNQQIPPHSVLFRQLGGIRASPPVNVGNSRSPTPAPEYATVSQFDRNRYTVSPAVYHGLPCIVPGDMRLMTNRPQAPVYRQPYRQQTAPHSMYESNSGRNHKIRKPRTKVPPLPPSGRQSNQSVQGNNQQRF